MDNKKLSDIDYRPLNYMGKAWDVTVRDLFKIRPWLFWGLVVAISVVLTYFIGQLGIYIGVLVYVYVAGKVLSRKAKIWKQFAEVNGWTVSSPNVYGDQKTAQPGLRGLINVLESREAIVQKYIPPGIVGVGHSSKVGDVVHAEFEGHSCDVFMYQFTTGSGKSRQTHYYTIARVILDRPFPHLILDSKHSRALKNRGHSKDSAKLEGNFSDHFTLYFDKNDQINALSIITPDVMQTLLQSNTSQDLEIVDNNLFFMIHSDVRSAESIPELFASIDALADEIKHKSKTIRYTPNTSAEAVMIERASTELFKSGNMVANTLSLTIVVIFLLPFIFIILLGMIMSLNS